MTTFQYHFEWDAPKAATNVRKHGVSFEQAATVFHDANALSLFDPSHSGGGEDRWITLGVDDRGRLLVVCHTWRETAGTAAKCRIISARQATRTETRQYQMQ
jgi:uncharacterized DUF497 family protein